MAEFDLTQRLVPFLDRHLAVPLLNFLAETELFPANEVLQAQYDLAKGTNMVDYTAELWQKLNEGQSEPEEITKKRSEALATNESLQQKAKTVLDVIQNPDVLASLTQDKTRNQAFLKDNYNLNPEQITVLYHFGQFQYTIGNYSEASDYLYHFRILSTDSALILSSQWGKLASNILSGQWDAALEELNSLRDTVDRGAAPLLQLQQRSWLLHWGLYVFFNHPQGREALVEWLASPAYLNTLQTSCPWLLRYLTAAVFLVRRSPTLAPSRVKQALRELVRLVQAEGYQYTDPLTEFVRQLYIDFDFESAQHELAKAEALIENDFFLIDFKDDFVESARYFISEAYCRIHQKIDIADLSTRLNMSAEEGEKWIVNLIRDTRTDAKIDFKENTVHMNQSHPHILQSIIERSRGLTFRSQALGVAINSVGGGEQQQQQQQQQQGQRRGQGGRGGQGGRQQREDAAPAPAPVSAEA